MGERIWKRFSDKQMYVCKEGILCVCVCVCVYVCVGVGVCMNMVWHMGLSRETAV